MANEYVTNSELISLGHQLEYINSDLPIEAASRLFDRLTNRTDGFYNAAGSASNRTFYGNGTIYLQLDPFTSAIVAANVTMPSGYTVPDFVTQGYKLVVTDSSGVILEDVRVATWDNVTYDFSSPRVWTKGVPVLVNATWGFSAVPADVKAAVAELAISIHRGTDRAFAKTAALDQIPAPEVSYATKNTIARWKLKEKVVFV